MLYLPVAFYVALSLFLLLTAILAARGGEKSTKIFVGCGVLFTLAMPVFLIGPLAVFFSLTPSLLDSAWAVVEVQFLALTVLVFLVRNAPGDGPRPVLPPACAIVAIVFGVFGWKAWYEFRGLAAMQERYPVESMESRLPEPCFANRPPSLSADAEARLARLENHAEGKLIQAHVRTLALQTLHQETVLWFIHSPGFGIGRFVHPNEGSLRYELREEKTVPQPTPRISFSAAEESAVKIDAADEELHALHETGVFDFIYPEGFGVVTDRRHVAGFQSHRFNDVPPPNEPWSVQTLDLVGLVLHPEPVAYVSANLPRMDELVEAPTRPLDSFETAGLERLRRGEDLVVANASPKKWRMLGSLRAGRDCVSCHGGKRGDLLGAFSYTLGRKEP